MEWLRYPDHSLAKRTKKAGWFSLSESHPAPACNDTQDSHRGSRPGILYATSFIPLKNKYRFRFLLLDTCFLFFCSLYSVLLDFLYLYGLFIFTFHYQVHFNDTFSSYHQTGHLLPLIRLWITLKIRSSACSYLLLQTFSFVSLRLQFFYQSIGLSFVS